MSITLGPSDAQVKKMRGVVLAHIRPRRTRLVALSSIVAIGLATAAAAAVIAPATTDQQNVSVDCYATANLSAGHATTMLTDGGRDRTALDPLQSRVTRALALCDADRRAVATDAEARVAPAVVVNPTVCQLGDLRLAVLPNEHALDAASFCEKLGLRVPTA